MVYFIKSKCAIFLSIKVTKIQRYAFLGHPLYVSIHTEIFSLPFPLLARAMHLSSFSCLSKCLEIFQCIQILLAFTKLRNELWAREDIPATLRHKLLLVHKCISLEITDSFPFLRECSVHYMWYIFVYDKVIAEPYGDQNKFDHSFGSDKRRRHCIRWIAFTHIICDNIYMECLNFENAILCYLCVHKQTMLLITTFPQKLFSHFHLLREIHRNAPLRAFGKKAAIGNILSIVSGHLPPGQPPPG